MRVAKALLVVALMAVASATTWMYAQQPDRSLPGMLPPADYIEILQLYGYYSHDVDAGSLRSGAWMFTEDGFLETANRTYRGASLKELYAGPVLRPAEFTGIRHVTTNAVIVPTPEGARGSIYIMEVKRKTKGGPIEITSFGKYEDRLVKTPKGWRFKERKLRQDTYPGSGEPQLPYPIAPVD